jgi:hypothetical protein
MPKPSWKYLNRRGRKSAQSSPDYDAPPYTLTRTGDELNPSEVQFEVSELQDTVDWKGGDVTADLNDSSSQSNIQDFQHLRVTEEPIREITELESGQEGSGKNAAVLNRMRISCRIGRFITQYSNKQKYHHGEVRHSRSSSSTNHSTSSSRLLLEQPNNSNSSSWSNTAPNKSFSITAALRHRRELKDSRNHHILHDIQGQVSQDQLLFEKMNAQNQYSPRQGQQEEVETRTLLSETMKKGTKKRSLPLLEDDAFVSNSECASANYKRTNSEEITTTNANGSSGDKLKHLPSWRSERILHNRYQAAHNTNDDCSHVDNVRILEPDWWTVVEEKDANITSDRSANVDISHGTRESCATGPTYSSDSSGSSASNTERQKRGRARANDGNPKSTRAFRNVGLSIWSESRAEWKSYRNDPAAVRPKRSGDVSTDTTTRTQSDTSMERQLSPYEYRELVKGLTHVTREYQLPKPMNLADLIDVYTDIWDCGHEK